uniref:Putative ovule protein n=1 Tax=Solanum chacoense TaxID=4108 RepID=A0A0V0H694_SOLCH
MLLRLRDVLHVLPMAVNKVFSASNKELSLSQFEHVLHVCCCTQNMFHHHIVYQFLGSCTVFPVAE